jgi:hypothetical protein
MKRLTTVLGVACVCTTACLNVLALNIALDGEFTTSFPGGWDGANFGGANLPSGWGVAAGGAQIYNDGWLSEGGSGADKWITTNGHAGRTTVSPWNYGGFGQMVTNPGNGRFDNGDPVVFSFDYVYNGGANGGFAGAVYGITAPNGINATWNLFAGESILLGSGNLSITQDYTGGNDYEFYCLDYLYDNTSSSSTDTYTSGSINLDQDYALFVVAFQGHPFGAAADKIFVDNVALQDIPEPVGVVAVALGLVALGRRFGSGGRC